MTLKIILPTGFQDMVEIKSLLLSGSIGLIVLAQKTTSPLSSEDEAGLHLKVEKIRRCFFRPRTLRGSLTKTKKISVLIYF